MPGVSTGVRFTNAIPAKLVAQNRLSEDGAGVAVGDIDGDGRPDLYFCRTAGPNALYRNLGDWRFEEIPNASGAACPGNTSTGAAFADVDGDGDLDLLVSGLGSGVRLFLNDGRGRFTPQPDSGIAARGGSRSMALADVDGDGRLDLYVANYRAATVKDAPMRVRIQQVNGRPEVPEEFRDRFAAESTDGAAPVLIELGEPDVLYRNLGGGKFESVSWTSGTFLDENGRPLSAPPRDWGLSAAFRDLNGDGLPDLYVCNDFYSPDRIWINDGHGHFRALSSSALRKTSWASMAVDFADIDRDGHDDVFVADMLPSGRHERAVQRSNFETGAVIAAGWGWTLGAGEARTQVMRNTLFVNDGSGGFSEVGLLAGVQSTGWTWGALFLDVDLDGYEDLLIANGHTHDHLNSDLHRKALAMGAVSTSEARERLFALFPSLNLAKVAFRNRGNLQFEDASARWGFDWKAITHGMVLADLDGDGDLEVVTNNGDGEAGLFRNNAAGPRVLVRLRGQAPNTSAVGARLRVEGGPVVQTQEIQCGGRYLSSDEMVRSFAAGRAPLRIEVRWRSGKRSVAWPVPPNSECIVKEPAQ